MYVLNTRLKGLPVMSLQTGQPIAEVERPLVNAVNLEILALQCSSGRVRRRQSVILMRDIRQFAMDCIIIDSLDDLDDIGEIVRLQEVAERDFDPIGKIVVSESGHKLGRVEDYTINLKTFMLQKLYVHQSMMKSIVFNNLVIDRTQIIEVSSKQFTVRDAGVKEATLGAKTIPQGKSQI